MANLSKTNIIEAIKQVKDSFPFNDYMDNKDKGNQETIGLVVKYLMPGAKILDFGAGPCDKTAILSSLGYQCAACDDLEDCWHKNDGVKEKILKFSAGFNIKFHITSKNNNLQFKKNEFDGILLFDILEHLHESPRYLLDELLSYLKPSGYIFISVPNAVNIKKRFRVILGKTNLPSFEEYYWYPGVWRGHIREYVKDDLVKLCKNSRLDIINLRGHNFMLWGKNLPTFFKFLFIFATYLFPAWRDSWFLVARKVG